MISRYVNLDIEDVFNRQSQLYTWRRVELAVLHEINLKAYGDALDTPSPTATMVADREMVTGHEFTAFLDEWIGDLPEESTARRWIHFGLTSSDVIDTAQVLSMIEAHHHIALKLDNLTAQIGTLVGDLVGVEQIGRTHGRFATPRPANTPWKVFYEMGNRYRVRMIDALNDLRVSDLSGPVGARDVLTDAQVLAALTSLGLKRVRSTQILPRDNMVHWVGVLAGIATMCEAIATQLRLLVQSGVGEFTVKPRETGYTGSSSMPHKVNPALAENVCGLARLARANATALQESIVQWGDRDLAHSSVERVAIPDLCHLVMGALIHTTKCLNTYEPNPVAMSVNLARAAKYDGDSYHQMTEAVRAGKTRQEAYTEVQRDQG